MSLSFREIQKLCTENRIKPARGKGVTRKFLIEKLRENGIEIEKKTNISTNNNNKDKRKDKAKISTSNKDKQKDKLTKNEENTKEECPICLEYYIETDNVITTICNHKFHYDCISGVRTLSCPMCRAPLQFDGVEKLKNKIIEKATNDRETVNIQFVRNVLVDRAMLVWGIGYATNEIHRQPDRSRAIQIINNMDTNQLTVAQMILESPSSQREAFDGLNLVLNIQ